MSAYTHIYIYSHGMKNSVKLNKQNISDIGRLTIIKLLNFQSGKV